METGRRDFIKRAALLTGSLPFIMDPMLAVPRPAGDDQLRVHLFSKHLQFLDYHEMSSAAATMGFHGLDLTVRPGGHVEPERVEKDLVKALDAIHKAGLNPEMITTAVEDASNPLDQRVLRTAASLGVKYYRMNWLRYKQDQPIPETMTVFKERLQQLGRLNRELGLVGCYQNHAGTLAGASLFELYQLLEQADQDFMGVQYDIRHATVEGGKSWENGLRLVAPRIKTIVIKDFAWHKEDGAWDTVNLPLGEGMVEFKKYFGIIKQYGINVPVSLHLEYDLGGAEHGGREISVDREQIFEAMKKDLNYLRQTWKAA